MSVTYNHAVTSGGAGTSSDQLAGTAVEFAGKTGRVRAAFVSTLTTTTATLKGAKSGKEIIPSGSHAIASGAITALANGTQHFIYDGFVDPGERLDLAVVNAATETWNVTVRID